MHTRNPRAVHPQHTGITRKVALTDTLKTSIQTGATSPQHRLGDVCLPISHAYLPAKSPLWDITRLPPLLPGTPSLLTCTRARRHRASA